MSFLNNLAWRYATKKFNGQKVSEQDLDTILTAIQMAPSASGTQPYHIVVTSGETKDRLIENCGQTDKLKASHLLVFCSRVDYPERGEKQVELTANVQGKTVEELSRLTDLVKRTTTKNSVEELKAWAARQAYIALGFGLAAAAELKIDACPMEGFKPAEFKAILELPEFMDPYALMALGYRDMEDSHAPEKRAKMRFPKGDLFDMRS